MRKSLRVVAANGLVLACLGMVEFGTTKPDLHSEYLVSPMAYVGFGILIVLILVGAWTVTAPIGNDA